MPRPISFSRVLAAVVFGSIALQASASTEQLASAIDAYAKCVEAKYAELEENASKAELKQTVMDACASSRTTLSNLLNAEGVSEIDAKLRGAIDRQIAQPRE